MVLHKRISEKAPTAKVNAKLAGSLACVLASISALALIVSCGMVGKVESKKASIAAPGLLVLKKVATMSDAAKLLHLRGGKVLRVLSKDGGSYGVKAGLLSASASEAISFKGMPSLEVAVGEGYALSADSGWFLSAKVIARYTLVDGKPKLFRAEPKGAHPIIAVFDEKLVAYYEGKLEVFSLKGESIVRTEIDWPLRNETPLAAGFDAASRTSWFATAKSFVYVREDGSDQTVLALDAKGLEGNVLNWVFKVTKENVADRSLPSSGAALTSKGLFVTEDLEAATTMDGAAAGPVAAGPVVGAPGAASKYDFTADVLPLVKVGCPACHDAAFPKFGDSRLETSWTTSKTLILDRISDAPKTGGKMPPTGSLSAASRAIIIAWLNGENKP